MTRWFPVLRRLPGPIRPGKFVKASPRVMP
jgi:hypothetical protein